MADEPKGLNKPVKLKADLLPSSEQASSAHRDH